MRNKKAWIFWESRRKYWDYSVISLCVYGNPGISTGRYDSSRSYDNCLSPVSQALRAPSTMERANSLNNRKSSLWLATARALRETDGSKGKVFPIRTLRSIDQYCKSTISPYSFT